MSYRFLRVSGLVPFAAWVSLIVPDPAPAACPDITPSGCLEIHYINVQQGTSTFLVSPDGTKTLLLDAGNNGKGNTQIGPYLQSIGFLPGLDAFTYTLASHLDADHIGGFDDLFDTQGYDVTGKNWYNGSTSKSGPSITAYFDAASRTSAKAPVPIGLGDLIDLGEGVHVEVVAVNGVVAGGLLTGATNENDLSVALLIQYGYFDFLWAGDLGGGQDDYVCAGRITGQVNLETPLAQALLPGGSTPLLSEEGVEVLHVNHHGSMSSTNSEYMNLLRPEVAIITTGQNAYEHPSIEVVDNVLLAGSSCITAPPALVLQTEEGDDDGGPGTSFSGFAVGDIVIKTDGIASYTITSPYPPDRPPDEIVAAGLPRTLMLAEVFLDGFEGGTPAAWSVVVP